MNILYLGNSSPSSTSFHRYQALVRLGNNVILEDPYLTLNSRFLPILSKINFHTGYRLIQDKINRWTTEIIKNKHNIQIIFIDSGELFGTKSLLTLKTLNAPIILYNIDDPTGNRDGNRFKSLLESISNYDLCVVMRDCNVRELTALGCKKSIRVIRSYDEFAHMPFNSIEEIPLEFRSEVAFIGTWMRHEKRDEFLLKLISQGLPLSIWGNRWEKSPHWKALEPYYRGKALGGRDYVAAIQGAKICLGLLSKGNRDLHTTRSVEIPYAGGLLCAERTSEHQEMYQEGIEAVFWSSPAQCVEVCKNLLSNDGYRESIRLAGMKRVRELGVGNEDITRKILQEIELY